METEVQTETQIEPVKEPPKEKPRAIALHDDMSLAPQDHHEMKAMIKAVSDGGGFPTRFKTMEAKVAAANLALALMGKKWQLALNNIADIKGQLTIYGELPGAIAEQTGQIETKRVFVIDQEYNEICTQNKNLNAAPFAGVCLIKRKGRPANEFTYTLADAERAGQYPAYKTDYQSKEKILNPDSPWMKFTKIMLQRKAMNMAIKFEFPDAIVACPIAEHDFGIAPDLDSTIKDVTPRSNVAADMNKEFLGVDNNGNGTVSGVQEDCGVG